MSQPSTRVLSQVTFYFSVRLGSGGSSDVYKVDGQNDNVVKVSRFSTAAVRQQYDAERKALLALSQAAAQGLVPELVNVGHRNPDTSWPLLLLRPAGVSLPAWVAACVKSAATHAAPASAASVAGSERRRCARAVAFRLLDALALSHAANIIHCDVRPLNVVVVGDSPMLVDWGSSRSCGVEARGCGVAAYALENIFSQQSFSARPAQDVAGVLYTWLCIAFDGGCVAPWLVHHSPDDTAMFKARSLWIQQRSFTDATVAAIASALSFFKSSRSGSDVLIAQARSALTSASY